MFNYSVLWEKRLITNVRLVGNQSKSCLVVLCLELGRHLQSHERLHRSAEVVVFFIGETFCFLLHMTEIASSGSVIVIRVQKLNKLSLSVH